MDRLSDLKLGIHISEHRVTAVASGGLKLHTYLSCDGCLEVRGEVRELFCVVLCTEAVHNHVLGVVALGLFHDA